MKHLVFRAVACLFTLFAATELTARTIVVTNATDAPTPPPGSLREAIELTAMAGDTIVFERPFVVTLTEKLHIDSRIAGLTIQGPAGIRDAQRGVVEVATDNVTIRNISFENVYLFGLPQIIGFRLIENRFGLEGGVFLDQVEGALVNGNTFRVGNRTDEPAVQSSGTFNSEISGNTIEVTHRLGRYDLRDSDSHNLVVARNTLKNGLYSSQRSGRIVQNGCEGPWGLFVKFADMSGGGPLTLLSNRASRIVVHRTDVDIVENTIRPAGPYALTALSVINDDPANGSGVVRIRSNDIEGGRVGIHYSESNPPRSVPAEILRNKVAKSRGRGIAASGLRRGNVTSNSVVECGTGTTGIGIYLHDTREDGTRVDFNTVTGSGGIGIRFDIEHTVDAVSNSVSGSTSDGIRVSAGSHHLVARDNRVFRNSRDGFLFASDTSGEVSGGEIFENGLAGVYLGQGAAVRISRTSFHDNTGPGIDLAPRDVTPNDVAKIANRDLDWPSPLFIQSPAGQLRGFAIPNGIVEVFQIEDGPRTGNPTNGEGQVYVATVIADALGFFAYPPDGTLPCPPVPRLTFTVTTPGAAPVTSEFSPGPDCESHANFAPVLAPIAPKTFPANSNATVVVRVGDLESPPAALEVSAHSSDPSIATVAVTGSGADRQIVVTPAGPGGGTVTVTVTVTDPGHPPGTDPRTTTTTFPVTVTPVSAPPVTLVSTSNRNNPTGVYLKFSGPLDPAPVENLANYTSGLGIQQARVGAAPDEIVLTTAPQVEGFNYTLQLRNLRDGFGRPLSPDVIATSFVLGAGVVNGPIIVRQYGSGNLGRGLPGTEISQLLNHSTYPHAPERTYSPALFEIPVNADNNYGVVISGWLRAPQTGNYTFFMSSDDQGELYLSTDDQPANAVRIAYEPAWNGSREFINGSNQGSRGTPPANRSVPINLVGNQYYFFEAYMKEGEGGDNLAVAWQTPGGSGVVNGSLPIGAGNFRSSTKAWQGNVFTYWGNVSVRITPNQNVTGNPGQVIKLAAGVDGSPPYTYQWLRNGSPIAGATSSKLAVIISDQTVGTYSLEVANGFSTATSTSIEISGPPDTVAPTLLGIEIYPPGNDVSVRFSEAVRPEDAANPATHQLSDSEGTIVALNGARMEGTKAVRLCTGRPLIPGERYTLELVHPVRDLSTAGNPTAAGVRTTFRAPAISLGFSKLELYGLSTPRPNRSQSPSLGTIPGTSVHALLSHSTYPAQPSFACYNNSLEIAPFDLGDNYGAQLTGWFTPPTTGNYIFYISSDDEGEFYLGTDASPTSQVLVCREPSWSGHREWTGSGAGGGRGNGVNISPPIRLEFGSCYSFTARSKEAGGGDHLAVAVQGPDDDVPRNGALPIGGASLVVTAPATTPPSFNVEPADQLVQFGETAEFRVEPGQVPNAAASWCGQPWIQWYGDGLPILGANEQTLRIDTGGSGLTPDEIYRTVWAQISYPGWSTVSKQAQIFALPPLETTLAPLPPSTAASADGSQIGVRFQRALPGCEYGPGTLLDVTAHSRFGVRDAQGNKPIDSVRCGPESGTLVIQLQPGAVVTEGFTVSVDGAGEVAGERWLLNVDHFSNPTPPSQHFTAQKGSLMLDVGGSSSWTDGPTFGSLPAGDFFDYMGWFYVNETSVGQGHAGFMARESDAPNSRFAALGVHSGGPDEPPGSWYFSLSQREVNGGQAISFGDYPVEPWMLDEDNAIGFRVARSGQMLHFYFFDGETGGWTESGVGLPWTGPLKLGVFGAGSGPGESARISVTQLGPTELCPDGTITIDTQPTDVTVLVGQGTQLRCTASLRSPGSCSVHYQWQTETAPGTGEFTDIPTGIFSDLLIPPSAVAHPGRQYRCKLGWGFQSQFSSVATVYVEDPAPPNQPPTFTLRNLEVAVPEGSVPITLPGFVTSFSPGPANEANQKVTFTINVDRPDLFAEPPAIDDAGTLTVTPAPTRTGSATATVVAQDDGGTANGGMDSSTQTFHLGVVDVTQPTLDITLEEGAGESIWVTLRWDDPSDLYELGTSPELRQGSVWAPLNVEPERIGDAKIVRLAADGAHGFFRLRSKQVLFPPRDALRVLFVPAPHFGSPQLLVTIDEGFPWPQFSEAAGNFHYSIDVKPVNRPVIADIGQLVDEERFSVVAVPSLSLTQELDLTPAEDEARRAQRQAESARLYERALNNPDDLEALLASINAEHWITHAEEERGQVANAEVTLVAWLGDRAIARQQTPTKPTTPKYTWGATITTPGDPCQGRTPEECAREKLTRLLAQICAARDSAGNPRFPQECAALTAMLARTPSEPTVECIIPSDSGVTMGITDPITHGIVLHGDALLTSDCAAGTLVHELKHSLDFAAGKFPNLRNFRMAEEKLGVALRELNAAISAGDAAAADAALTMAGQARAEILALETAAGRELITAECDAFFQTIDHGAAFGYPNTPAGVAWMKENVKGAIGEIAEIRNIFNLPLQGTQELCDCFRRLRTYVDSQPAIKANFDQDLARPRPPKTWSQLLHGLTRLYCGE